MRVLYFALLRERVGLPEETVSPPDQVRTVGDLIGWLRRQSPQHDHALADPAMVRIAVNQDYAGLDHPLQPNDEIAFFPPVTGG